MVDLDWVSKHFNPADQRLVGEGPLQGDGLWTAIDMMLQHCPVVHTDGQFFASPDGSWIVNSYAAVKEVIQDPALYSNRIRKGNWAEEPAQIPFDIDPPALLDYRRILLPHLTVQSVSKFEPTSRAIITGLIDEFCEAGHCDDLVSEMAHPFSTQVQMGKLVGLEEGDHKQVLKWVLTFLHGHFHPEFEESTKAFISWIEETIARRHQEPPRDDLISTMFAARFDGRSLTDDEITRMMMSLILGGVTATADQITNIIWRLAVYPELQDRLQAEPEILPHAIEEFLRIEPSATGAGRVCTRDTVLAGQEIKKGEQLIIHLSAANRDPAMFEHPHEVNFDREKIPHVTFGMGHHRCLGSNFARLNIRVVMREVLARMRNIRLVPDDPPQRVADLGWMVTRLPVSFDPSPRAG